MDLIAKASGGINIIGRAQALPRWYPEPESAPATVEVWWSYDDETFDQARFLGTFLPGQVGSLPYNPDADRDVRLYVLTRAADGTPSVSSLDDAVQATVLFRRETEAPVIGQVGEATTDEITVGVSGYTRFARKRRVRVSSSADMSAPLELLFDSSDYISKELPKYVVISRTAGGAPVRTNVALASLGSTATASSSMGGAGHAPAYTIDGSRIKVDGHYGWQSATATHEHWLDIDFGQERTIDEAFVVTQPDDPDTTTQPTEADTFTLYGLNDFELAAWNSELSSWAVIPGTYVEGNNNVMRRFTFDPITTNKIRLWIYSNVDGYGRVFELEAWGDIIGALAETVYVTVAHSGGSAWGPESGVLEVSFASDGGSGGSTGTFDPVPRDQVVY
jgi:hypothetical protein